MGHLEVAVEEVVDGAVAALTAIGRFDEAVGTDQNEDEGQGQQEGGDVGHDVVEDKCGIGCHYFLNRFHSLVVIPLYYTLYLIKILAGFTCLIM